MMKKLAPVRGDHGFSLDDDFGSGPKRIAQTRYFKAGDVVIAIGELNKPNHWNDKAFDAACKHLQTAWNSAIAAGTRSAETRSKAPSEGCQSGPKGIAQ